MRQIHSYLFSLRAGILLFLLLLVSIAAPAQTEVSYRRGATQLEDILPPSPEAASRVKYSDVPFTHSTGAAEYSVPIYELKGRRLTIPISLDYCSNGIRMDEIAGVAGLGWTLSAGGCITREVVYMPDEFTDGGFSYSWPSASLLDSLEAHSTGQAAMSFLRDVAWNRIDTNSDRYSYSVLGLKGQFIIDPDGNVVQLQGDGVLIGYSTNSVGERTFTITGPDGTVYTFAARETGTRRDQWRESTYSSDQQVDWTAVTAWYLTSVTSRDGTEEATFSYYDGGTWDRSTVTSSKTVSASPSTSTSGYDESYSHDASSVRSEHHLKLLTGISLSGFSASFTYATVSSHSLHTVESGYDADNYPWRLTAVTVTSPDGATLVHAETATHEAPYDGRVILGGVSLKRGGTLDDRWAFSYRTAGHGVSRYSQDWFGFFNGENGDWTGKHPGQTGAGRTDLCPYLLSNTTNYTVSLAYGAPDGDEASYMMLTLADHDGARTAWDYEGAASGNSCYMGGTPVPVSVGVRVRRIRTSDRDSLTRVRTFTYGSPAASTTVLPVPEAYLSTSSRLVQTDLGFFQTTAFAWTFTLHEGPVSDGQSLQDARIWYGTVTEEASADGTPTGNRTVYTYDTSPCQNLWYNTLARFPAAWQDTYSNAVTGIAPFSGIQSQYCRGGATEPPRLICVETWRRNPSTGATELVVKEETTYTAFPVRSVFSGYKAVQVMQGLNVGELDEQDLQHYPLYSQTRLGAAPSGVTRITFHPSGNDTTRVYYHASRVSFDKPPRTTMVTVPASDATRCVTMTYPDTWRSDCPAWVTALASQHALSTPVRRMYTITSTTAEVTVPDPIPLLRAKPVIPIAPAGAKADTITVVTEYSDSWGGLMPSATVEYLNGTESWREDILSRDVLGNPSSVKAKGKPVASIVWSYNGLYPVAVVEGGSYSSVLSALGGQNVVNGLTQSSSLSPSQQAKLDGLRTASQTSSSHVTTLTHAPGRGVLSVTAPSGIRTSYTYDHGGRLASVTDGLGEITDEYTYNLLDDGSGRLSATHYTFRSQGRGASSRDVSWWNTLGLKTQDIAVAASGDGSSDLVTAYESDYMLHDDIHTWLPYPAASGPAGSFREGAAQASATYHGSTAAYSGRTYEESSRDRVLKTTLPGYAAHPNELSTDVVSGFPMLLWRHGTVEDNGNYFPGDLVAEVVVDADGRTSCSVKDHQGRLLATKQEGAGTGWDASTRYVYDELDRLAAVIGACIAVTDTLSMWRYGYDDLGRLSSKGVPGSVREYYTYDNEDRIVTITRGNEFTEIGYDAFGRVTDKYLTIGGGTRTLTESHRYDGYTSAATTLIGGSSYTSGPKKGLETWTSFAVTDGQGGFSGTASTAYAYDALGRQTRSVTQYADGHKNTTVISYDFSGNPVSTVVTGLRPDGTTTDVLSVTTEYDLRERPSRIVSTLSVGGVQAACDTTDLVYDALGRSSAVSSGPVSGAGGHLVSRQQSYTLHGWTASQSFSLAGQTVFSEVLSYDGTPSSALGGPSYTGQITRRSETWTVPGAGGQGVSRTEDYAYDSAGRLSAWDDSSDGEDITYDARGNITSRSPRHGTGGTVTLTYAGDRLATRKVGAGAAVSFSHDSFARMTTDAEAGLSITYSAFDLPETVSMGNVLKARYTYLADGTKISALDASGAGLLYRGPFTYRKGSSGAVVFESAPFGQGRLTGSGVRYHVTDHLGSVRAVIDGGDTTAVNPQAAFYSIDDYTPFGTKAASTASSALTLRPAGTIATLRDSFTGKEDQGPDFGVPYTDFGARHYSPSLSRWLVPDPLGEKYYDVSPYAYCGNNPVGIIDPNGKIWEDQKKADKLSRRVQKKIDKLTESIEKNQRKLDSGSLTEKRRKTKESKINEYKERIKHLQTSLDDIDLLGKDKDHVYSFAYVAPEAAHNVVDKGNGRVEIETSSDAISLHEIAHVRQSLNSGGLTFEDGFLINTGKSYNEKINNEIEGYRIQFSFDTSSFPGQLYGSDDIFGINRVSVSRIRINGEIVYDY